MYCLDINATNETTITIPSSILVYQQDRSDQKLCEFDGMIIFPMRKENQLILLEAKNTKDSSKAKKQLGEKLKKLEISFDVEDIKQHENDAYMLKSV